MPILSNSNGQNALPRQQNAADPTPGVWYAKSMQKVCKKILKNMYLTLDNTAAI